MSETKILDGRKLGGEMTPALAHRISDLTAKPKLVIIQVGDHVESNSYIKMKMAFAAKIGALVEYKKYSEMTPVNEIVVDIKKYNSDSSIHGIMVQLPIPAPVSVSDANKIVEAIDPKKDVDGLTAASTKSIFDNTEAFIPATTKGILTLLEHYDVDLVGKRVVIVGESVLVGRPTALAFLNKKATVVICHEHTKNLAEETKRADVLVVAVGKPGLISSEHVSAEQVVVDVGTTISAEGKTLGDVDFESVKSIVAAITPVPGGVGPMTVYSLFENLVEAAKL